MKKFVSRLMNLLPQSAVASVCLSKKSPQCVCVCECSGKASWQVAPLHLNPPAAASEVAARQLVPASHGLLNSLTFFCVSGSWFRASGPSQPPTERSHNNKWRAGEAESSSVSAAESLVVFTANRIPFQWLLAAFLEATFISQIVWCEVS